MRLSWDISFFVQLYRSIQKIVMCFYRNLEYIRKVAGLKYIIQRREGINQKTQYNVQINLVLLKQLMLVSHYSFVLSPLVSWYSITLIFCVHTSVLYSLRGKGGLDRRREGCPVDKYVGSGNSQTKMYDTSSCVDIFLCRLNERRRSSDCVEDTEERQQDEPNRAKSKPLSTRPVLTGN